MNCSKCGNEMEQGVKFCKSCGEQVLSKTSEIEEPLRPLKHSIVEKTTKNVSGKHNRKVIVGISSLVILLIVFIVVKPFLFRDNAFEASDYQNTENQYTQVETSAEPVIKPEDLYGTWEYIDDVYYIIFNEKNLFAIHSLEEAKTANTPPKGIMYAGNWEIVNGEELVLHATEEAFFNYKLQEVWKETEGTINFNFILEKNDNIPGKYTFVGGRVGGSSVIVLNIKKMLTVEEFTEMADKRLLDKLNEIYSTIGNYKVDIVASSWSRRDERFAQGECKLNITDTERDISEEMDVNIWYFLRRTQNLGGIYDLSIKRKDPYEMVTLYQYDSSNGIGKRTDQKPLLPKSK